MSKIFNLLMILLLIATIAIIALQLRIVLSPAPQQTFAFVDMEKVIAAVVGQVDGKPDSQVLIQKYKVHFDKLMEVQTGKYNKIVFSSVKVIAGADDITEEMVKAMREYKP